MFKVKLHCTIFWWGLLVRVYGTKKKTEVCSSQPVASTWKITCLAVLCILANSFTLTFYHSLHKWWHQTDEWYRAISEGGQSGDLLQQCLWQHLWWLLGYCWCRCGVQTVGTQWIRRWCKLTSLLSCSGLLLEKSSLTAKTWSVA